MTLEKYEIRNTKYETQRGFTLVELIVVLALSTIIGGVGLAAFSDYSKKQEVYQTAQLVKQTIERAKFNALSSIKPQQLTTNPPCSPASPCLLCDSLQAWIVYLNTPSVSRVSAECIRINGDPIDPKYFDIPIPLPAGFDDLGNVSLSECKVFMFRTLTNEISCINPLPRTLPTNIIIKKDSIQRTVTVKTDGTISFN